MLFAVFFKRYDDYCDYTDKSVYQSIRLKKVRGVKYEFKQTVAAGDDGFHAECPVDTSHGSV